MTSSPPDATVSFEALRDMALRWFAVCGVAAVASWWLVWGPPSLPATGRLVLGSLGLTAGYGVALFLHEGIHALAMRTAGRVPWRSISFRLKLAEGVAYVHTEQAMTARAYRWVLLAPNVALGLVPWGVGLAVGSGWLVAFAGLMLASGLGDFAVWRRLRGIPSHTLVRDHPTEPGCEILG